MPIVPILSIGLLLAGSASAATGELAKVDEALHRWRSLDYQYEITTLDMKTRLRVRVQAVGRRARQRIDVLEPISTQGTRLVMNLAGHAWLRRPGQAEPTKIQNDAPTRSGWLGTALSYRDLRHIEYSKLYDATLIASDKTHVQLRLQGRADRNTPYSRIDMNISRATWLPVSLIYYQAGKKVKTETRTEYRCKPRKHCPAGRRRVVDLATGATSELVLSKLRVNARLKASLFDP